MAQTTHKPGWWLREKALIVVSAVVVVLGVAGITAIKRFNDLPAIVIPNPKMPSPNAFDYFNKAGSSVVDNTKIGYAIDSRHVPDPSTPDDRDYTQAEKEFLVGENAPALKTLRQGFAYPYLNPPCRSFSTGFPYYTRDRDLARLLKLEGQALGGRGDWGGAVESDLDAVQLGMMVPHGSVMVGGHTGIACEAIGRKPIWLTYRHLNAAQLQAAAGRLERLAVQEVPIAQTMNEEKWSIQAGLMEVLKTPHWSQEIAFIALPDGGSYSDRDLEARLILTPKRRIVEDYQLDMDRMIKEARRPYAVAQVLPSVQNDPLSQMLFQGFHYDQERLESINNLTQNALLMTTLALHAYFLEHGAYPTTLASLSPGSLKTVPVDPFAQSGPLRYRLNGNGYVLYSVGPDGKDNGGRAIFDPTQLAPTQPGVSDPRRYIKQNSKGDIVAGVNLF